MLASLKHNLGGLLRFSGRSSRTQFWPYAAAIVVGAMIVMPLVMMPVMTNAFAQMQRFAAEHPELAAESTRAGGHVIRIDDNHPGMMPVLGAMMNLTGTMVAIIVLLLAAAVTRRLHDRDWRGWWALTPLVFLSTGFAMMSRALSIESDDITPVFALFANNVIYLTTLAVLVVLLSLAGTPGPNRFGPPPA